MLAAPAAVLSTASLGDIVNHPPTPAYLGLPLHRGAIDKTTITTHAPPEAMRRVRVALQSMGIIVQAEGEYRYRCIRPRRLLDSEALVEGKDSGLVVQDDESPISLPDVPEGVSIPDSDTFENDLHELSFEDALPQPPDDDITPTTLHPSTSFDSPPPPITMPSPPPITVPSSPPASSPSPAPTRVLPTLQGLSIPSTSTSSSASSAVLLNTPSTFEAIAYGAHTEDPGDEVRFSVEITRLDRLDGTYSLDIRRLKGNLRSYKFVYDSVRTRVSFAPTGTRDGGGG